jgi:hypothetical protein
MISCDGGKTWIENRRAGPDTPFSAPWDFSESGDRNTQITFSTANNGWFLASHGWGSRGRIKRSQDGVNWTTVLSNDSSWYTTYMLASGNGATYAATYEPVVSIDGGANWTAPAGSFHPAGHTNGLFVPYQTNGRFFLFGDGGFMVYTDNQGVSHTTLPANSTCVEGRTGYAASANGNIIVITNNNGMVCTSLNGGTTWAQQSVGGPGLSNVVRMNNVFYAFDKSGFVYLGTIANNNVTWTNHSMSFSNSQRRPSEGFADANSAVGTDGVTTLVATGHLQGQAYGANSQAFYRSTDGINWEVLAETAFTKGHPIIGISYGNVPANQYCHKTL